MEKCDAKTGYCCFISSPGSHGQGRTSTANTNFLPQVFWLIKPTSFSPTFNFWWSCLEITEGSEMNSYVADKSNHFVSETTSSVSSIKTYWNPLTAEEHVATSEFYNTERVLVTYEKCLKTCMLLADFHVNTQSPMQKLHANCFTLKKSCTVVHSAFTQKCNIQMHKFIWTSLPSSEKRKIIHHNSC